MQLARFLCDEWASYCLVYVQIADTDADVMNTQFHTRDIHSNHAVHTPYATT